MFMLYVPDLKELSVLAYECANVAVQSDAHKIIYSYNFNVTTETTVIRNKSKLA